jgi:hypothetical protein
MNLSVNNLYKFKMNLHVAMSLPDICMSLNEPDQLASLCHKVKMDWIDGTTPLDFNKGK